MAGPGTRACGRSTAVNSPPGRRLAGTVAPYRPVLLLPRVFDRRANSRWTPACCIQSTPRRATTSRATPSAPREWRRSCRLWTAWPSSATSPMGRWVAAAAAAVPPPPAAAATAVPPPPAPSESQHSCTPITQPWPYSYPQARDLTPSLPAALPEGLLGAVHTAEHVAALQATSASVSGPTAVRDPDDPGGGGMGRWALLA